MLVTTLASGDLTAPIAAGATVLGLLLAIGSTVGVWLAIRVGRSTQTLANYKAAAESASTLAESLKAELGDLREHSAQEMTEARQRESEAAEQISGLRAEVAVLRDLATGQTQLVALTDLAKANAEGIQEILDYIKKQRQEAA